MIPGSGLVLAAVLGFAPSSSDAPTAQAQVLAAERAWSAAFLAHDREALSRLIADDFVGIDGRGWVSEKTAELDEAAPPGPGATAPILVGEELSDVRVRVYGDTAVLTALNTARFSSAGTASTILYRRTTVWVRRESRWQCVSFHGSRVQE
jgi:ketosteroid isomerase-like protein